MELPDVRNVKDLKGKKVLLRTDLNVLISDGKVGDDFRLTKALETITFLQKAGAKIILISHIGKEEDAQSLKPVYEWFKKHITLLFVGAVTGAFVEKAVKNLKDGDIIMLENVRTEQGECINDISFSKKLASVADIYVNDAFSASHRKHASIVGLPQFLPSYIGVLFQKELSELSRTFKPESPSLLILGGAKIKTKLPLIKKFLNIYDNVFVGGVLANAFFKARGWNTGLSETGEADMGAAELLSNEKLVLPVDVVVKEGDNSAIKSPNSINDMEKIVDAGPKTIEQIKDIVESARFITWNGPLGEYEYGFSEQTRELAKVIAHSNAQTIVGGGDTIAAIAKLNLGDKFSFVSTAGGAMLVFLLEGTLVGIDALKK
ncbi:phosphoglycerate kinase [Patescibacteria group bacterium]|nr:phosphoglycerate kinase [Patescibacteria group bacterium]